MGMTLAPHWTVRVGVVLGVGVGLGLAGAAHPSVAAPWRTTIEAVAEMVAGLAGHLLDRLGNGYRPLAALIGVVVACFLPVLIAVVIGSRPLRVFGSLLLLALAVGGLFSHSPGGAALLALLALAVWSPGSLAGIVGGAAVVSALVLVGSTNDIAANAGLAGLGGLPLSLWSVVLLGLLLTAIAGGIRVLWGDMSTSASPDTP